MPPTPSLYVKLVPPVAVIVMVPLLTQLTAGVLLAVTEMGVVDATVTDADFSQPAASFANIV